MPVLEKIYWGDVSVADSYLYGSQISYYDKIVVFENLTFASGKAIKTWHSRTNFEVERKSPELPLLYAGQTYRLESVMTVTPSSRAYFQVTFFNRQKEEIGYEILRESNNTFTYPEEAFTYTLTLFNAGCDSLTFSHVTLFAEEVLQSSLDETFKHISPSESFDFTEDIAFVKPLLTKYYEE